MKKTYEFDAFTERTVKDWDGRVATAVSDMRGPDQLRVTVPDLVPLNAVARVKLEIEFLPPLPRDWEWAERFGHWCAVGGKASVWWDGNRHVIDNSVGRTSVPPGVFEATKDAPKL